MRWHGWFLALVCLIGGNAAGAQAPIPTQQELETRLKSQFLMLRGMWDGSKLAFDAQGNLVGTAKKRFFSQSAVLVERVYLTDNLLEIQGKRAGLEFQYKPDDFAKSLKVSASPLAGSRLDILIARDPQHPESISAVLTSIFAIGIDDKLTTEAPFYWQRVLHQYLHPNEPPPDTPDEASVVKPGKGVSNPVLYYAPPPNYSPEAKYATLTGVSLIGLVVDARGIPQHILILRPLGMGLDEQAVASVYQYRFKPALYLGKAVPARIQIEVNFRLY